MLDYLFIKVEKNYYKLKFSEILYIQAEKKYVHIVAKTTSHVILISISQIEKLLPQNLFCRIHRSYIISLEHTSRFNCDFAYIGIKKIPISEHYRNLLKNAVITLTCESNGLKLDNGDVDKLLIDL